jgi:aubergine-like protein
LLIFLLFQPLTLVSKKEDDTNVLITVTLTREIVPGDHEYLQFFNILLRRCLAALNLKLVGRNFFDPSPKVKIALTEHNLELWPGYIISIRQHENDILLCTEMHKVMRTDSVLDVLSKIANQTKIHGM